MPADLQRRALRKLEQLDVVDEVSELMVPPGNKLEKLKGDREGQYSIRPTSSTGSVSSSKTADTYDVEIVDYR